MSINSVIWSCNLLFSTTVSLCCCTFKLDKNPNKVGTKSPVALGRRIPDAGSRDATVSVRQLAMLCWLNSTTVAGLESRGET